MSLTIDLARAVLAVGYETGAWTEEEFTAETVSEERALAEGQEIFDLCRTAYGNGIRSDSVLAMLAAARVQPPEDNPTYYDDLYVKYPEARPDSVVPAEKPTEPEPAAPANAFANVSTTPTEAPVVEQDVNPPTPALDISDVFPKYDDAKVGEIVAAIKSSAASGDLTEDEFARIKAYEEENEGRKKILELVPEFKPKPQPKPEPKAATPAPADTSDYGSSEALEQAYTSGTLGMDRATQEGLFIPPEYTGEEPVLAVDVTEISDQELTRLVMRFHSLEARTLFRVSQEEGRREVAQGLASDAENSAYLRNYGRLKEELSKTTEAAVDRAKSDAKHLALTDDSYTKWNNRARRHGAEVRTLKALAEGYEKAVARLSREQSRRENLRKTPTS